jgi:diguanylate cyclase (GGDEF)-like protein
VESEGKTREELIREVEQLRAEVDRLRKALAEQGHAQQDMRALSHADELTGLYNRGTFFTLGLQQLSLAERNRTPLLLLYCRLQGWEQIRSTHGIPASEEALGLLTGAMRETFRQSDLAARVADDSFAILAIDAPEAHGPALAERLRGRLAAINAEGERTYQLSLSVGFALWDPQNPCSVRQLLARAEEALRGGPPAP